MNKKGIAGGAMVALFILLFVMAGAVVWFVINNAQQQQEDDARDVAGAPPSTLLGKSSTLSITARDISADDQTTRRAVPVYIQNTEGDWIESGGTSTSSTTSQAFTSGIAVADGAYRVLAFNATFGSANAGEEKIVDTQSETLDIDVFTRATSIDVQMFDKDDNSLLRSSTNLTLSAGETDQWSKLRIRNNATNTAIYLEGFYMDLEDDANITSINFKNSLAGQTKDGQNSLALARTTLDDMSWALTEPVLLFEFDQLDFGPIVVQADGDDPSGDPTGEAWTLYVVDSGYFFSAKGDGVLFGPETDATSPGDVGVADFSFVKGNFL